MTVLDRNYTSSWTDRVRKNVDHVLGRVRGTLRHAGKAAIRAVRDDGDAERTLGSYDGQFERDARAIRHGREMAVPIEEGIWTLEVIEAVRTAAAQDDGARIGIGSDAA